MKNTIYSVGLTILLAIISVKSFSQDQKEQKAQIKPALLIIDIQNAYLKIIPEREKEDVVMSHNSEYTDNVEEMFDAVGTYVVKLILENSEK